MLKLHVNFAINNYFALDTFLWECPPQKSGFDKGAFIFVNAENKSLLLYNVWYYRMVWIVT